MAGFSGTSRFLLRLIHWPPRILYAIGLGPLMGNIVLLLTTVGRRTHSRRVTPLQYEEIDGLVYLGAARGERADWVRNILANPRVELRLKSRHFTGTAETTTDAGRIADFLQVRLQRHPQMIGAMLRSEGIRVPPERCDLEQYASRLALVVIKPD